MNSAKGQPGNPPDNNARGGRSETVLPPAAINSSQVAEAGAAIVLAIEDRVRAAASETELVNLIANETRKLVSARQAIVLRGSAHAHFRVEAISSVAVTDRDTPFVRWVEAMIRRLAEETGASKAAEFELPAYVDAEAVETRTYPFPYLVWQPMRLEGDAVFAGMLVARERPWQDAEKRLLARQAEVFAANWKALYGVKPLRPRKWSIRSAWIMASLGVLALAAIPVPMTTLAPVEIVARMPQRVTAPIDGIIKEILAEPNQTVRAGQPLVRFDDTTLRNKLTLAEREMLVAKARYERAQQAAFSEEQARHELAIARSEFALKQAERDYAHALLAQTVISAERDGLLIYADKDQWIGRPVRTGERIMHIADPAEVIARIELPVSDAIVMEQAAKVRLFLDANPLSSISAHLSSEGYHAEPNSTQQLVYKLLANIDAGSTGLRIGARGTAQLQGRTVPLIYYLLRRPIAAARQHLGL